MLSWVPYSLDLSVPNAGVRDKEVNPCIALAAAWILWFERI
jgi:hypothetical protein